jgi:predicted dehydrogenase
MSYSPTSVRRPPAAPSFNGLQVTNCVEAMTEAAQAARVTVVQSVIGFNYRCIPALALAKSLISEGGLGRIRHVRAAYVPRTGLPTTRYP